MPDQEERVAVRRRMHDRLGAEVAAGARSVLDDELLAEPLGQALTDQPRPDPPGGAPTIKRTGRVG